MAYQFRVELTNYGIPVMWEEGGAHFASGSATIIADFEGNPKQVLKFHTCRASGKNRYLIPIAVGDVIVSVDRHYDKMSIMVERITDIHQDVVTVETCSDLICADAILAAIDKSSDSHCCKPCYIKYED